MRLERVELAQQPANNTKCGAYCLAYYKCIKSILDDTLFGQQKIIDGIYPHVQFKPEDLNGLDANLRQTFLQYSNPIRMMKLLHDCGLNPKFYTGGSSGDPLQSLISAIRNNWQPDQNDGYSVTDDSGRVINGLLPIDQIGWFIAIWHTEGGLPQHYVLYHRTPSKIIAYNPTANSTTIVAQNLTNRTSLEDIMQLMRNNLPARMTYHGAGIWIG